MINIAIMGYGVVGSGVVEVLKTNQKKINESAKGEVNLKYILDIRDFNDDPNRDLFTKDFNDILNDESVMVVVETIGGLNPAYDFTKRCLIEGKHVITSNKELVAEHGTELLQIAREKNVGYFFEASVGGGIPIIRPLYHCLSANKIEKIVGILNGTTNYILTQMINEGKSFKDALKEAQQKGYAEANPESDIKGYDAKRKIAILSSLAFGKAVSLDKINTQGIEDVSLKDVHYAQKMNGAIKLLGISRMIDEKAYLKVSPMIVKNENNLSHVDDVFNAIMVRGNMLGESMFFGQGAGKLPTASAVVADIIDAVRHIDKNKGFYWAESDGSFIESYNDIKEDRLFILKVSDKEKIKNKYINTVDIGNTNEIAIIIEKLNEKEVSDMLKQLAKNDIIKNVEKVISILD